MPRKLQPGVFCIEGPWSPRLTDRKSVKPLLELLEDVGRVGWVHRQVTVWEALEQVTEQWCQKQYSKFPFGYFAFHGSPGMIHFGRDRVSLEELGDLLAGSCAGKIIHFGSCKTLQVPKKRIDDFQRQTRARAVTGFRRDVDWIESAAFELLLIDASMRFKRRDSFKNHMNGTYNGLARKLGFDIHYA
jgi:hypothetical protein